MSRQTLTLKMLFEKPPITDIKKAYPGSVCVLALALANLRIFAASKNIEIALENKETLIYELEYGFFVTDKLESAAYSIMERLLNIDETYLLYKQLDHLKYGEKLYIYFNEDYIYFATNVDGLVNSLKGIGIADEVKFPDWHTKACVFNGQGFRGTGVY